MIYFWDNGEPGYDGHDALLVESDASVDDVLALLSIRGHVDAVAEVALTRYRLSLAEWWKQLCVYHYVAINEDREIEAECAAWKTLVGDRRNVVHADCNCELRPLIDAAIKLGLVPAKETP